VITGHAVSIGCVLFKSFYSHILIYNIATHCLLKVPPKALWKLEWKVVEESMVGSWVYQILNKPTIILQSTRKSFISLDIRIKLARDQHGQWPFPKHIIRCHSWEQNRISFSPLLVEVGSQGLCHIWTIILRLSRIFMRHVFLSVWEMVCRNGVLVQDGQLHEIALSQLGKFAACCWDSVSSTRNSIKDNLVGVDTV